MIVNKFGNYIYIKTEQYKLVQPPIVKTIREISFKSICIFILKESYEDGSAYYKLENNHNFYEVKITGKIQNIDVLSDSILISINQNDPVSQNSLIGSAINKGDIIRIFRGVETPSKDIFDEFILLSSVIQDE